MLRDKQVLSYMRVQRRASQTTDARSFPAFVLSSIFLAKTASPNLTGIASINHTGGIASALILPIDISRLLSSLLGKYFPKREQPYP